MKKYQGVWPVAPTPFTETGALDLQGMKRVLDCILAPILLLVFLFPSLALTAFVTAVPISTALAQDALWGALTSGNHVALIRHSFAPGYSDPDNFVVNDCTTQRNLDDTGRNQARTIGKLFRANGISSALVHSSQWCRCLETARLLDLGAVNERKSLNSFFKQVDRKKEQTDATRKWIEKAPLTSPTVLVTHQVNIIALTGVSPSSGEIVFVKRGPDKKLAVVGTIKTLH